MTRDATLEAVQAILHAAGCVIGRQQKIAGGEEAPEGPRQYRQLHGWRVEEPPVAEVQREEAEPVLLPFAPVTEPRRVNVIVQGTREFVAAAAT
ncbi:MAG TPA: hypothetical protein PKV72_03290 [Candidatus Peribacteria bacterium]|nr:hypothetical protein [Candidatus Peribacteria bacterium]